MLSHVEYLRDFIRNYTLQKISKVLWKPFRLKKGLKEDDPRLVIPFYDADKNLIAFQGRGLW
jgi:hypothetical protein